MKGGPMDITSGQCVFVFSARGGSLWAVVSNPERTQITAFLGELPEGLSFADGTLQSWADAWAATYGKTVGEGRPAGIAFDIR